MVYRPEKGTLLLDKRYPGVGRIVRRSGTMKATTLNQIKAAMDQMYSDGRLEVLEALRDKVLTPLEFLDSHKKKETKSFRSVADLVVIKYDPDENPAAVKSPLFDWLDSLSSDDDPKSETTRRGYRGRFKQFLKFVPDGAKVGDIPLYLERMRRQYEKAGKYRSYNETRMALQSFLSKQFTELNATYQAIIYSKKLKTFEHKPKRTGNPLSVGDVLQLMAKMSEAAAAMFWTLCCTGMIWKEYTIDGWEVDRTAHCVRIHGVKRTGRDRRIPILSDGLVTPSLSYKHFRKELRKASKRKVVPKDARNTFARWMEEAEIIETHRQYYMGHKQKDLTAGYSAPRFAKDILDPDAVKLLTYIDRQRPKDDGAITVTIEPGMTFAKPIRL